MSPVYIYALVNDQNQIRYVGKTYDLAGRLRAHRSERKKDWLAGIRVLEVTDEANWQRLERRWIKRLRARGIPLTNQADGGEGVQFTDDVRRKLRLAQRNRPAASAETRKRQSDASRGKSKTQQHRENIARGKQGWQPSAQTRQRMSQSRTGKTLSSEHRQNISRGVLAAAERQRTNAEN